MNEMKDMASQQQREPRIDQRVIETLLRSTWSSWQHEANDEREVDELVMQLAERASRGSE